MTAQLAALTARPDRFRSTQKDRMSSSPDLEPPPPDSTILPSDPAKYRRFVKQLEARADHLLDAGARVLSRHGKRLPEGTRRTLEAQLATLQQARKAQRKAGAVQALLDATEVFDATLDEHLGRYRKSTLREYVDAIFWAVLLTLLIRAFVFEAFKIPTGSMIPTLQIHDHLFVNKFLYGLKIPFTRLKFLALRDPQPGEIIVFEYPYDDDPDSSGKDLIKRVIGVAGDRVRVVDNVIIKNGKPLAHKVLKDDGECGQEGQGGHRCEQWLECINGFVYTSQHHVAPGPGQLAFDSAPDWPPAVHDVLRMTSHAQLYSPPENKDFPDFVIPPGHLLVMGDNRDNSKDGRFFGLVPLDTVKGKAGVLWFATDVSRIGTFVHHRTESGTCEQF